MNHLAKFLSVLLLLSISSLLFAQVSVIPDFKKMKADELTGEQIEIIRARLSSEGISVADFEKQALAGGGDPVEVAKLSSRLTKPVIDVVPNIDKGGKSPAEVGSEPKKVAGAIAPVYIASSGSTIVGADLFSNTHISFEPNLNMPTPLNYVLSAGDLINLDIYGYSEATYKLKVSSEGNIRIPNIGPIFVNGLTIEQAKNRITDQLIRNGFSNIEGGKTSVQITLGEIRSIKVTMIGDVTAPGTYTLPSLATIYTALYASGGPGKNGSFRDIQLIRNNKVVTTVDVYDFLIRGDKTNDIVLKDQDIIKINPYRKRVTLSGEVKRAGIFEAIPSDSFQDILDYSGGFTDQAYQFSVNVVRLTDRERQIMEVSKTDFASFKLFNGDIYTIGKILDRFSNRVTISGAVFRPGDYALTEKMTLSDLIRRADGLREDAYFQNATLFRINQDLTPSIQSVNIQKVLNGSEDVTLQKEDRLVVYSKFEIKEAFSISIRGEVLRPGSFPFSENMHLKDLVYLAGGRKESASKEIEISRRIKDVNVMDRNAPSAKLINYKLLSDIETDTLVLQPFDEVFLKPIPGYNALESVTIQGEVVYPGSYVLQNKEERISSLVKRSGGLTASAYEPGSLLIRSTKYSGMESLKEEISYSTLRKSSKVSDSTAKETIEDYSKPNYVGFDLKKAIENPGSKWDLILKPGDNLSIPTELQTVKVYGRVLFPSEIIYKPGKSVKGYINEAGGLSQNALRKRIFVVYANGSVKSTKSFLGIHNYPNVMQGASVFVPVKERKTGLTTEKTAIIISTLTAISTLAVLWASFK